MPELSVFQFSLAYNAFSFTFAAMFAAFLFFVLARMEVSPQYRGALIMSALVVAVAGYHYLRIFESWNAAYQINEAGTAYFPTGEPFNDAYRYIDWLLTVPLLVAELIAVINPRNRGRMTFTLALAAVAMVMLGYPGEIADSAGQVFLWGFLSTLPFLYIIYVLFTGLGDAIDEQPGEARVLVRNIRLLLLATWGFYPLVYMLQFLDAGNSAGVLVSIQVGYAIADVAAKAGYGLMIYGIARAKSVADGYIEAPEPSLAPAGD